MAKQKPNTPPSPPADPALERTQQDPSAGETQSPPPPPTADEQQILPPPAADETQSPPPPPTADEQQILPPPAADETQSPPPPPAADELVITHLVVKARADGFRRCGRAWPASETTVAVDDLAEGDAERLLAEPMLLVVPVAGSAA